MDRNVFGLREVSFSSERISCFLIKPFWKNRNSSSEPSGVGKALNRVALKAKEQKTRDGFDCLL